MRHRPGGAWDETGDNAVADVAGESLLVELFSRIEDERDRVLVLAHIGLDLSLRNLARVMGVTRVELADRVSAIIARLRQDTELADMLGDIHHVGRNDRYQALIFHLGLQDWFCSYCGDFMLQSESGPKRKTCSGKCRQRLWKVNGIGWKNQHLALPAKGTSIDSDLDRQSAQAANIYQEMLRTLLQPIDTGQRQLAPGVPSDPFWWQPDTKCRDRAVLLLGFMCPIPLSSSDLAAIHITDISRRRVGLEVRLTRRGSRRINQETRYIIVPASADSKLCPSAAMSAWLTRLTRTGRTDGPLFVRMNSRGELPKDHWTDRELTGEGIAQVITNASRCAWSDERQVRLAPSSFLPDFLKEIANR